MNTTPGAAMSQNRKPVSVECGDCGHIYWTTTPPISHLTPQPPRDVRKLDENPSTPCPQCGSSNQDAEEAVFQLLTTLKEVLATEVYGEDTYSLVINRLRSLLREIEGARAMNTTPGAAMSQHTPRAVIYSRAEIVNGTGFDKAARFLEWTPERAKAPEMLAALKAFIALPSDATLASIGSTQLKTDAIRTARALLREIEGAHDTR